jgi:outer membrane protein insertion porin family
MRLSPVLVAFFATTATLSVSNAAEGQSMLPTAPQPEADSSVAGNSPSFKRVRADLANLAVAIDPGKLAKPWGIAPPQLLVQATPGTPPAPIVPPGEQSVPQQEPPDQIRLGPGAPPAGPNIPAPAVPAEPQPTTPAPAPTPDQPVPTPSPTQEQPVPTPTPTPVQPTPDQPSPVQPTPGQPTPTPTPTPDQTTEPEPRVLVAEVAVQGATGTFEDEIYRVIRTQPGRTTTRSQLQEDINAIFRTGFFSSVQAVPEDTPLGVRVTFQVTLNPPLQRVQVEGATVLPPAVVDQAFQNLYGRVLNLNELQEGIKQITKWYQDNGYVLAQVIEAPRVSPDGVVTLEVAEGQIENIQVRFVDKDGNICSRDEQGRFVLRNPQGEPVLDKNGNPARCRIRTRDFIVTREFELKPGGVFNRTTAERDLQRVFGLGIFEDVKLSLNPGQDPRQVVVVANVTERNTGNISAGAGISSASGLFGTVSYQQTNLGGNNQRLGAEVQLGQREFLFDVGFTDPWIGGDPFRTSYSVNLFRRRTISLVFDGGDREVELDNGDRPRVVRTGGSLSFSRPLSRDVYRRAEWTASLGLQYQRVETTDEDGEIAEEDERGNPLTFSGEGKDDLLTLQFGVVRDRRNDLLRPTRGSLLRLGTEQSIPIGQGSIFFNRLRGSYSFYVPTRILQFTPGCRARDARDSDCPQVFAFNIQGGTVVGDLPPYEAFVLGGSNSVRGYDEGDLASARSFLQATVEYRFPIFNIISGALFVDAATDFGSQDSVTGRPGSVRRKPGSGFGYGIGVRVQSPLGPIRVDYAINDEGDSRLHFGIGERF